MEDARQAEDLKVLVILGHPRPGSFCAALAAAYAEGARAAGMAVERLDLEALALTYLLWFGLIPLAHLS